MSELFSFKDMDYNLQGDNVRTVNYGTETYFIPGPLNLGTKYHISKIAFH